MKSEIVITEMLSEHWDEVSKIFKEGIDTGLASLELEVPNWDYWNKNHLKGCRHVAFLQDKIIGWVALSPVSNRKAYKGVAEVSVYITNLHKGKSIGSQLMNKTILESKELNIWTLQAVVFPENKSSIKIFEKYGFRQVGYRERISKNRGKWQDTILLERRSKVIGN